MNKYITRYYTNNKEDWTNLTPTWRRYSTIIMKILSQNIRFIHNSIFTSL